MQQHGPGDVTWSAQSAWVNATPASTVPSVQPAFTNVIANVTGEQEAASFSSIGMPVDLHIDTKLMAKIQGNSYIDFGGLLSHRDQTEQYQLQVPGTSVALVSCSRWARNTSWSQMSWSQMSHCHMRATATHSLDCSSISSSSSDSDDGSRGGSSAMAAEAADARGDTIFSQFIPNISPHLFLVFVVIPGG